MNEIPLPLFYTLAESDGGFINFDAPSVCHAARICEAFVLICVFYEDNGKHRTGILFVIKGDTFNKV